MIKGKPMQNGQLGVKRSATDKKQGGVKVSTGSLSCDKRAEERDFYKKRKLKNKR